MLIDLPIMGIWCHLCLGPPEALSTVSRPTSNYNLTDSKDEKKYYDIRCLNAFHTIAGVTILLSLTVFMNMVSEIMPNTSDAVPLIGKREKDKNMID